MLPLSQKSRITVVVGGPWFLYEVDSITVCLLFKLYMHNKIHVIHTSQQKTAGICQEKGAGQL